MIPFVPYYTSVHCEIAYALTIMPEFFWALANTFFNVCRIRPYDGKNMLAKKWRRECMYRHY